MLFSPGEGLITYMRTDGVTLSDEATKALRSTVAATFGNAYVPDKPRCVHAAHTSEGHVIPTEWLLLYLDTTYGT